MLAAINTVGVGPIFYSSGTAFVRYLYVRSSFEVNIQEVLKRDTFIVKSILMVECINIFNFCSFYFQLADARTERSPLVLYQACMSPGRDHTFEVYKLKPWNQLIMIFFFVVNVLCNLFLYRFLGKMTANIARSEFDRKKDRKRNLVPAHIGMIVFATYVVTLSFFTFTYSYKSDSFDSATRAFLNAAFVDLFHFIISPVVIIAGSMDARRRVREIFENSMGKIRDIFT